jgi:hypothetical protein
MMTKNSEEEIWKRRREQAHPPTPGNPAFSVKDIEEALKDT